MLKNKLLLIPALALSCFISTATFAETQNSASPACTCQLGMEKLTKELNLTSDQQAKIQAIKESNKSTIKENKAKLKSIRSQINDLASSKTVDENKLNELINQKTTLMATMIKNKVMIKNQIFNVFTPEQQQKYKQIVNDWESKKAAAHHHCGA